MSDLVIGNNLGVEFDQGNIQTDKIRLKLSSQFMVALDGTISLVPKVFYEATGTGTQTMTLTPATLNMGVTSNASSDFTNTAGVITYSGTSKAFYIEYGTNADAGANVRSVGTFAVYINGTLVPRTTRSSYHRILADGEDSTSARMAITLNPSDTIEVRGREEAGGDNVVVQLVESNLLIEEV